MLTKTENQRLVKLYAVKTNLRLLAIYNCSCSRFQYLLTRLLRGPIRKSKVRKKSTNVHIVEKIIIFLLPKVIRQVYIKQNIDSKTMIICENHCLSLVVSKSIFFNYCNFWLLGNS